MFEVVFSLTERESEKETQVDCTPSRRVNAIVKHIGDGHTNMQQQHPKKTTKKQRQQRRNRNQRNDEEPMSSSSASSYR